MTNSRAIAVGQAGTLFASGSSGFQADRKGRAPMMILSEEFLRHANDCEHSAKFARDPMDRATWSRMAERWTRCAKLAREHEQLAYTSRDKRPSHRQSAHAEAK